ncbi:kinesin family member 11 [Geosmithia morbida]|uniref:Kinesin family member 11 n=1 Tax=Geosmithia morbida TaxID=1094350 RepID=A0A9P4Z0K3_9HYPO|nr:kinesin family member 11 [Geosmithia morbida]KAF4125068.1 kinesin family member 11 [Geosmithia morbida]
MYQRSTRSEREAGRSSIRPGTGSRTTSLRQPTVRQATTGRQVRTRAPPIDRSGAVSPTESVASAMTMSTVTASTGAGSKRKERDFEAPHPGLGETNINVVVRCRGRNPREVKENSTVVVNTDATRGKLVELSMGASAISDKTYSFDRVFAPAADQSMVYDDTVKPILDDMLAGFNCTIFAYGQTGTGKTYTMSGDMTETLGMLSDEAGIIPRVLQNLFNKLELDDTENCVKCSFIELYNEELRDLLSVEEATKLRIYDDASRRGHLGTIVQGMEEKHIKNAAEGIKVLQDGSLKRQVAATKCNDLSSRSHTVFTITAYVKKTNENGGEDLVAGGKLNLVDLAGSENIQRSGAENKRAAEAGLINKSLLTLGRVINALVDRNAHIPYRESKLTRLLQDSLGGRTKTCIIATISPAKTNLEETISTLDYAFRAKNIRNKPQLNAMLNKKTLLREFTAEIEKLKSDLIATRQRNGVYLSNEAYEEMTAQSESNRIVLEEKSAKVETLESNLRNKVQELFSLTTNFMGLKKDHESTKALLNDTKGLLDKVEIVLADTRDSLARETELRKAHAQTEGKLAKIGDELIGKLNQTVHDVSGLHAKNKRKSDLQLVNRATWGTSQDHVADVTSMIERRVQEFKEEQYEQIGSISHRMGEFVQEELQRLTSTQSLLDESLDMFSDSTRGLLEQKLKSKDDMDEILEDIKIIRDNVKVRVGDSLRATISKMGEKIAAELVDEAMGLHSQLHGSYSALGKDFKSIFDDLVKHLTTQRSEASNHSRQVDTGMNSIGQQSAAVSAKIQESEEEERRSSAEEAHKFMAQFSSLFTAFVDAQQSRFSDHSSRVKKGVDETGEMVEGVRSQHSQAMADWDAKEGQVLEEVKKSRDQLKTKLKDDWTAANDRSTAIQNAAKNVHAEAVRVVGEQVEGLDTEMEALDDFVTRAKAENAAHHDVHTQTVKSMSNTVEQSLGSVSGHFKTTFDRVRNLGEEMDLDINDLRDGLEPLDSQICQPLANLRDDISNTALQEYQSTGETPQKVTYQYPTKLPRTSITTSTSAARLASLSQQQEQSSIGEVGGEEAKGGDKGHPGAGEIDSDNDEEDEHRDISNDNNNTMVFADLDPSSKSSPAGRPSTARRPSTASTAHNTSLREVDPNLTTSNAAVESSMIPAPADDTMPLLKHGGTRSILGSGIARKQTGEGRENLPPTVSAFAQGGSRRKSPRFK